MDESLHSVGFQDIFIRRPVRHGNTFLEIVNQWRRAQFQDSRTFSSLAHSSPVPIMAALNEMNAISKPIVTKEIWDYHDPEFLSAPPPPISRGPSSHVIRITPLSENEEHEHDGPSDDRPYHYGRIWRSRSFIREYAGEFFGTMMLVMFGTAANCQYNLSIVPAIASTPAGTWASVSLGWGAGIALGSLLSGGHINPAVTLAMAVWRGFPWRKVPGYMLCQLLGALCGAAIVYGNYLTAINIKEGGSHIRTLATASYFGTVPLAYMTNIGCFFDEFIGTALLLFGVCSLLDRRNELSPGLVCVGIFIVFVGIAACFGMQTGFALNPARDLEPRILTSMVGYGTQVYTLRHQYWLWSPILATFTGAQLGVMLYDVFLYTGDQSIVNRFRQKKFEQKNSVPPGAPQIV